MTFSESGPGDVAAAAQEPGARRRGRASLPSADGAQSAAVTPGARTPHCTGRSAAYGRATTRGEGRGVVLGWRRNRSGGPAVELEGVVRNGVIVPDADSPLPEGTRVRITAEPAVERLPDDQLLALCDAARPPAPKP